MNTLLSQSWVLSPTPENDLPPVELCRVRRGSCSLDVSFWVGDVGWGVVLLLCEDSCQKEEGRSNHLPHYIKQRRPRHETWASRLILCYYVKSSEVCAALDVIRLDCGGEMYSPEYIGLYYLPSSTTHPSQPLSPKPPTLPEINAALKLLVANLYKNIVHYLSCVTFIINSFTGYVPKAQSNRRTAVGWSSSKAATHVVYYVRTFRHGSQNQGTSSWRCWPEHSGYWPPAQVSGARAV